MAVSHSLLFNLETDKSPASMKPILSESWKCWKHHLILAGSDLQRLMIVCHFVICVSGPALL